MTASSPSLMILIAGPYRSGTGDDPAKMAANVQAMEAYALPLFRAGHLPVVGEWLALPLVALAGSTIEVARPLSRASFGQVRRGSGVLQWNLGEMNKDTHLWIPRRATRI